MLVKNQFWSFDLGKTIPLFSNFEIFDCINYSNCRFPKNIRKKDNPVIMYLQRNLKNNQNSGLFRFFFVSEIVFLSFILFRMTDLGILVSFLILSMCKLCVIKSKNRLMTMDLFLNWLRSSSQFKMRIFSLVNRVESLDNTNGFSSSDNPWEFSTSKFKTTFDETLFTFCPPAPLLRTALKVNSDKICSLFIVYCSNLRFVFNDFVPLDVGH